MLNYLRQLKPILVFLVFFIPVCLNASNDFLDSGGSSLSKITIFPETSDGYLTNWPETPIINKDMWDLAHNTLDGVRMDAERTFIEVGSGISSDNRFYIHRARLPFLFTKDNNLNNVNELKLKLYVKSVMNSIDDGNDFIVLVHASSTDFANINESDYLQIGKSAEFGWANADKSDILEISNRVDISDLSIGDEVVFEIKKDFYNVFNNKIIVGIREGHDILNIYPEFNNVRNAEKVLFYSMNENNSELRPSLEYYVEQDNEINPLILIPGIMCSWPKDGELVLDPIMNIYDNLWNALIKAGYKEGATLFSFPYQWRNSNVITADLLEQKIEEIINKTGKNKVDIIAHSMGGLVTREYLNRKDNEESVDKLIFLATPHLGAPEAYLAWEGGDMGVGFSSLVKEKIFYQEAEENLFFSLKNYINKRVPTVGELLPVYDYIYDKNSVNIRTYPSNYPRNLFLENLNNPEALSKIYNLNIFNYTAVSGESDTITSFEIKKSGKHGMWSHGKAKSKNSIILGKGDNTVPETSNTNFNDFDTEIILFSNHFDLMTDAQKSIVKNLTGETPDYYVDKYKPSKSMLLFQLFSPVDILIENSGGEKVGRDFFVNKNVMEINRSYYTGNEARAEFVSIVNPESDNFKISLQGLETGSFRLLINFIEASDIIQKEYKGEIRDGEMINFSLDFNPDSKKILHLKRYDKLCDLLDKLRKDLNFYNQFGSINKNHVYNILNKKIESLEKKCQSWQDYNESEEFYFGKYLQLKIKFFEFYLNQVLKSEWLSQEVYDVLLGDLEEVFLSL